MKKFSSFFILLIVFVFSSFSLAFAEDGDSEVKNNIQERREEVMDNRKDRREELIDRRHDRREEIKDRIQDRREEFRDKLEDRREAIKAKIESRRKALKDKLDEFKDKRKAQIAERVSTNLNKINDNRVDAMTRHLDKMEELLGKVEAKAADAKADGKDVSEIEAKVAIARTKIEAARSALATQAGKDYTLIIEGEDGVKSEAKENRDDLHGDLKAVHDLVVAARQAVSDAIKTAYSLLGKEHVDNEEE